MQVLSGATLSNSDVNGVVVRISKFRHQKYPFKKEKMVMTKFTIATKR